MELKDKLEKELQEYYKSVENSGFTDAGWGGFNVAFTGISGILSKHGIHIANDTTPTPNPGPPGH